MMEHTPASTTRATGLTRRQMLQRSALVGGAVLATQSLGIVSAHAMTSPAPGDHDGGPPFGKPPGGGPPFGGPPGGGPPGGGPPGGTPPGRR